MTTGIGRSVETQLLIGGEWTNGDKWADGQQRIGVHNPAHPQEAVGSIVRSSPRDVDRAIQAALHAQPTWGALGYRGRAEILAECLTALDQGIDERAVLLVRENGCTLPEARRAISGVASRQRITLEMVDEIERDVQMQSSHSRTVVTRTPYGVVASVVPWNSPVGLGFLQIIPALLTGNTLVVKPPQSCPLTLTKSIGMIASILPPGTVNVVTGRSGEIGHRLTTHPGVAKIAFTGSVSSGVEVMRNASGTIKAIALELGGNDPAILLDDVDLSEATLKRMASAAFRLAGQVCMNIKRIYVPRQREREFVAAYTEAVGRIVIGDGLDSRVTMGPLHNREGLGHANELLADAEERGAAVAHVGHISDETTFGEGYFMRPALVTNVDEDARIWVEEQFAPAIPIRAYDDLDDAICGANDSTFGLGASVWGKDVDRAVAVASRLEAGTIWVNAHGTDAIDRRAPYGGIKRSGVGRRAGREGLEEYMRTRTLTVFE